MAETKTRKPPEPRGLTVTLPLDVTEALSDLAVRAGITTKAQLAEMLLSHLVNEGVSHFKAALLAKAKADLHALETAQAQALQAPIERG